MKIKHIVGLDDIYYYEKLKNGLKVYLCPNNNLESFSATFFTKFGSVNTEFKKKSEKEYHKVPFGIAHFL